MRIARSTLTGLPRGRASGTISPRAERIRQTLQDGRYTIDLDRLAGCVIASALRASEPAVAEPTDDERDRATDGRD